MPLYRCTCPKDSLSEKTRADIAQAITDIHCDVTGAPRTFVHVFFFNDETAKNHSIMGSIRAGRTDDQKQDLYSRMAAAYAAAAGVGSEAVTVSSVDVPAKWVMEGGSLLPEPGEEEAWLEKHETV